MLLKKENNTLTKEENKSLIRTLYQLYDKGDIESIMEYIATDITAYYQGMPAPLDRGLAWLSLCEVFTLVFPICATPSAIRSLKPVRSPQRFRSRVLTHRYQNSIVNYRCQPAAADSGSFHRLKVSGSET